MPSDTRRAVIFHPTETIGGGEKVALEMARTLHSMGYRVELYTHRGTKKDVIFASRLLLGDSIPITIHEIDTPVTARLLGLSGRFVRLRYCILYNKVAGELSRLRREALVLDTRSNMATDTDIVYIHYPQTRSTVTTNSNKWRIYNYLVSRCVSKAPKGKPYAILTNSSWTAKKILESMGVEATPSTRLWTPSSSPRPLRAHTTRRRS